MSGMLSFFLRNMWEKSKGPGGLYVGAFIVALMVAYASLFPSLVEIFGTTTRVFPAVYLAIAAISWGIRGAIPVTLLNVAMNVLLHQYADRPYEGGILGPMGCLFATSLVGMISDLAKGLDHQLQQRCIMEAVLKDSEERYRRIFNTASDAMLLIDGETGIILEANTSASKIYGYDHGELVGMRGVDISAEPEATSASVRQQEKQVLIRYHRKKNGDRFPVEVTAEYFQMKDRPVHVIAIRDISARLEAEEEKKRLETQFYQAQKMESIGTLAGGIAHDFNNLLGGIMGHASLGLMKVKSGGQLSNHLSVIGNLSRSGEKLTKHLLGFARGGKYEVQTTDFNKLLSQHNLMFGRTHKHITIHEKFEKDLWHADVDREQIKQVFFNIYINASQAMSAKGSIFVATENINLRSARGGAFPVKIGEYLKISVRDTGKGMDEETRKKIFEPFFSTKEKGVGTGLGMAAAYGIVKNHGGYIHVLSKPGKGTNVIILLPRSEKMCEADTHSLVGRPVTGTGTILVVDDETEILNIVDEMLKAMGYVVMTANTGRDAVSLFREKSGEIDLVLLDIIMPDQDGYETLIKLKEIRQDVRVLFQTGYSLDIVKERDTEKGCVGVIQKPFTIHALSHKIKSALNFSMENRVCGADIPDSSPPIAFP